MSASGVDKSALHEIGRDILLVTGYDEARDVDACCACPPGVEPRRVSVDAIEHWMIYREHPEVGAILHVHAWIEGTVATEINYPCGTVELAESVAELVRQAPDPSRAVVGQRNHGLTITGHSLDEIFDRIDGRSSAKSPWTDRISGFIAPWCPHCGCQGTMNPAATARRARARESRRPGDGQDPPPRRGELGQTSAVRSERGTPTVVLPAVALETDLVLRPCEVEAISTSWE